MAYRVKLKDGYRRRDVVYGFLNSYTLLQAELGGRHYGGGVLELVPTEAEALGIPVASVTEQAFDELDGMIRAGAPVESILDITDRALLIEGLGLPAAQVEALRRAYLRLRKRRLRQP